VCRCSRPAGHMAAGSEDLHSEGSQSQSSPDGVSLRVLRIQPRIIEMRKLADLNEGLRLDALITKDIEGGPRPAGKDL
jgi:hypothetical protein